MKKQVVFALALVILGCATPTTTAQAPATTPAPAATPQFKNLR